MTKESTSQVQQGKQAFKAAVDQHLINLSALYDELGRLEETGISFATTAIDDYTKLVKGSLESADQATTRVREAAAKTVRNATATAASAGVPVPQGLEGFRKLAEEQVTRMGALYEELGQIEQQGAAKAVAGFEEYGRLMKESLRYGAKLSAEWRKLTVEATRRAADLIGINA